MKKGFTLAEVLITLGIIGVVAALVIPQIITNIEKQKTLVVLKRAYSDLHKYLKDYDYTYDCSGTLSTCASEHNQFINSFSEYLETKQNFKRTTRDKGIIGFNGTAYPNGINGHVYSNAKSALTLQSPNGQYIYGVGSNLNDRQYSIFWNQNVKNSDTFRAAIVIYTNPDKYKKSKARMGRDIFITFIMQSEKIIPNGIKDCGHSSPWYGWCYYCGDWRMKNSCNPEIPSSDGWGCLSRIIEDGWQIKYF